MPKLQVTGDFMLIEPLSRIEFNPGEPVEVEAISAFMAERIESGQLAYCGGLVKQVAVLEEVVEAGQLVKPKPAPLKRRKRR